MPADAAPAAVPFDAGLTLAAAMPRSTELANVCCPSTNPSCCFMRGALLAGAGFYLMQPFFENNPAYLVVSNVGGQARLDEHVNVSQHMEVAPLLWLGYIGECGFGGRGRYWYFREGTNVTLPPRFTAETAAPLGLPLIVAPGQTLNVTTKLEIQVADIEALQSFRSCNWDFLISGGVRLARIAQAYNAFIARGDGSVATLLSDHSFDGVGPVLAAEIRRPLGATGLFLYGSPRGSLLFGRAGQAALIASQNNSGADHRQRSMLIGELEIGLEYGRPIGQSWLFGQIALMGQDWLGAGSASRSTLQVSTGGAFTTGSTTVDSDIGFLGLACRLGVNY